MHFISMYVFLRNPLIMLYPLSKNERLLRLQWWLERILISAEAHRWRCQSLVPTAWIHGLNLPCVNSPELWPLLNGVRNVLSWLTLCSLLLIIHRLNFTACFAANYVPQLRNSLTALIYTSFSIMHHINAKVISNGFMSMTMLSLTRDWIWI